jgi:hypothetical protein
MTATELLSTLTLAGCQLEAHDETLRVLDPQHLTDALRRAIRQHKSALLALLSMPASAYVVTLYPCPVCGSTSWGPCEDDPTTWHCLPCAGESSPLVAASAPTPASLPPGRRCPEGSHVPSPPDVAMPGIRQCQRCVAVWTEEGMEEAT